MSLLQNRLRTARRSLAHHANRLKRHKKPSRKSTLSSIVDPTTMLLKAAVDQATGGPPSTPPIAILETQLSIPDEDAVSEHQKELREKLAQLETCETMIRNHGTELVEVLSRELSNGIVSRTTFDRLLLFKMAAGAMVKSSIEFTSAATGEVERLKQRLAKERELRLKVQRANFELGTGLRRRAETEDDEFFDAIEGSSIATADSTPSNRSSTVSTPSVPSLRRCRVPPRPSNSINYLSLMKNCIGKDLSKISMPVDFNEPLSALQRQTEDLEYAHLLDQAWAEKEDAERRLAFVAIFALSAYSTIGKRTAKPFNPLLGETFDFDRRSDLGWKAVAEQVSHHPPTYALAADSLHGWTLNQSYTFATKVKGRSLCVIPIGGTYVRFPDNDDLFTYEKVSTATRMTNIMTGNLQTDNCGQITVRNRRTGGQCVLKFHEPGYFSKEEPRKVSGAVLDPSGVTRYRIEAVWDRHATLFKVDLEETIQEEIVVWKANPLPKDSEKMHNFSKLAIELNEPEEGVPSTDSRLRPDQRLMEDGHWVQANEVKHKLEEAQRARARQRDAANITYKPRWFHRKALTAMVDKNDVYEFDASYWDTRQRQEYGTLPQIFEA